MPGGVRELDRTAPSPRHVRYKKRHARCSPNPVSRSLSSLHLSPLGKWIQSLIRTGGAQKGNTTTRAHTHTHTHTHVHACTPCPFLISNPDSSTQTTKVRSVRATPSKTHDYRRLVALGTPEVYMGQGKPLFPGLLRRSAALIATLLVAPTEITHNGRLLRGPHQQEASGARRHLDASPASAGTPPGTHAR